MDNIIPVILAGGSGTRLWPLSRSAYPKPFLPLLDEKSLLQNTVLRVLGYPGVQPPCVVCHEDHRFIVAEQLRQISVDPQMIILEPQGKNTAPAVALAAQLIAAKDPKAHLWVLPADHVISDKEVFWQAFSQLREFINADYLGVFGTPAESAQTGYGYIKTECLPDASVMSIVTFIEKPPIAQAEKLINSGNYFWNCGIFAFRAQAYLDELESFAPDIFSACMRATAQARKDGLFVRPEEAYFLQSPNESIDRAVLEKTAKGVMVALAGPWNDIGSWDALMREGQLDACGNVACGDVVLRSVENSYLHSSDKMLTAVGIKNQVVVVTEDAVLVADKNYCQEIKQLVQDLQQQGRDETHLHVKVFRPWGHYQVLAQGAYFKVKKIVVNPHQRLSLQRHRHRSEHWVIVAGQAHVRTDNDEKVLHRNQSTFMAPGTTHGLSNRCDEPLELIEVQIGEILSEDDIERLEDMYGRVTQTSVV